jgi:hypothetical protein
MTLHITEVLFQHSKHNNFYFWLLLNICLEDAIFSSSSTAGRNKRELPSLVSRTGPNFEQLTNFLLVKIIWRTPHRLLQTWRLQSHAPTPWVMTTRPVTFSSYICVAVSKSPFSPHFLSVNWLLVTCLLSKHYMWFSLSYLSTTKCKFSKLIYIP